MRLVAHATALAILATAAFLVSCSGADQPRLPARPNVLFIAIDDLPTGSATWAETRRSRRPISTGWPPEVYFSRKATARRRSATPRVQRCSRDCGRRARECTKTTWIGGK